MQLRRTKKAWLSSYLTNYSQAFSAAYRGVMFIEVNVRYNTKIIITYIVSLALIGCVPFPTKNTVIPNLSGTLTQDGVGLSEYSVYLTYGSEDACLHERSISTDTNKNGEFIFEKTQRWSLVRWAVPLDSIDYFNLCFVSPDGVKKWAYMSHMRTPAWAPDIKFVCSFESLLSSPQPIKSGLNIHSTCRTQ
ncbi:hypothetical protein ACMZOO_00820 [Catenovulum sp. SX2]|uniref:hypothetical protein n=1 Tax=Catenovulum sp. SX2 TaxID=3398614 RepID=UPI003F8632C3